VKLRSSGLHLIGTLLDCDKYIMSDSGALMNLLKDFPPKIGMTVVEAESNPYLHRTQEEFGYTGGVTLYESHFLIHCWPEFESVDFDIFSCKLFDHNFALNEIREFFKGITAGCVLIKRGHYGAQYIDLLEDLNYEVE